ncbi:MAG TPA: MATE family efflux transporter [Gemmatimonadetes bacterium]|nr:MATE family efflux transporter [Gemmatimonadota bacterium]
MHVIRLMVPSRDHLASLVRLALPVATVQVGFILMGAVDTVMVGHVSPRDLAAVALGNLYYFLTTSFGLGTLFALDPLVSQAFGAGDRSGIARALQRGFIIAIGLAVVSSLLLMPGRPLLTFLRQPAEVIPIAADYALVSIPGVLPFFCFVVLRQSLQSMGRVAPIVVVIVLANFANVFFNWILIFGNLGAPALGAIGSGWATMFSRWFMFLALVGTSWPLIRSYVRPIRADAFDFRALMAMSRLGIPIGIQFFLEFGVFGMIGILMGSLGTIPMASHQVAINLASITFMMAVGVTQATTVLVGQAVGAGDAERARRSAGAGLVVAATVMTFTGIMFLAIPGLLARIYTPDLEVLGLAATLIPVAGIFQVFDGLQAVGSGVLRGVGDTLAPMRWRATGVTAVGIHGHRSKTVGTGQVHRHASATATPARHPSAVEAAAPERLAMY